MTEYISETLKSAIDEINNLCGEDYFNRLVEKLAELVAADYAIVGKFEQDISSAQTLALWGKGQLQDNFSYSLAGTPCQNLACELVYSVTDGVTKLFPQDQILIDMGIEGYLGTTLKNSLGQVVGLIVALYEQPVQSVDEKQAIFELFSIRAAAELDRYSYQLLLEEKLALVEQQNRSLKISQQVFDHASEGILVTDADNCISYANQAFERISGYSCEELEGQQPKLLNANIQSSEFYQRLWCDLEQHGCWQGEMWNRKKDGCTYPVWASISAIPKELGGVANYVSIYRDISQEKEQLEQISYQATHDQLTGLQNRYEFYRHAETAIASADRHQHLLAFLLLDVDRFKQVNDSLGHAEGDRLLQSIARRLKNCLRKDDLLARLGGDEFAVLVSADHMDGLEQLVLKVLSAFDSPFALGGNNKQLVITTSVGVSVYPCDSDTVQGLLNNADQALYQSKDNGRNTYTFFTEELEAIAKRHQAVYQRLLVALKQGTVVPHFQPIIDLRSGQVSHCEALARWHDEELGTISPGEFIAVAENVGLMRQLGRMLFDRATRDIQQLNSRLSQPLRVAINRSPLEFIDVKEDEAPCVDLAMERGLAAEFICVEITENLMIKAPELAKKYLQGLARRGISLAIDDFGTGYSSISYLKHYPFNTLKVDRSFVRDICSDKDDYQLVKTIISMAHSLGMKVVAEGVETQGQLELLMGLGCNFAQGFLFSPALPLAELESFVADFCLEKESCC